MLKTVVSLFIILHGLTHTILAMVPSPKHPTPGFARFYPGLGSWLLSRFEFTPALIKTTALVLSLVATAGFVAAGLALFDIVLPTIWWRTLAIVSSVVSLLLLVAFWNKVLIIGLLIDLIILITLLFIKWSPV